MERVRLQESAVQDNTQIDQQQPSVNKTYINSLQQLPEQSPTPDAVTSPTEDRPREPLAPINDFSPPIEYSPNRFETLRRTWKERREELTAKIHTPESEILRSNSLKSYYRNNPEAREQKKELLHAGRQKHIEKRREEMYGENVGERLHTMYIINGMSIGEIAKSTGFKTGMLYRLLKENGIEYTPQTHPKTIKRFQEVQKILWEKPELLSTLTELQKEVIHKRFLTDGAIPSLEAVGKELGVTRANIDQIEKAALKKLQPAIPTTNTE